MKKLLFILAASTALTAAPVSAMTGEGTAESPYLISSVADWTEFANMTTAAENADNFEGKFLSLTADVDFTGAEFVAVGSFAGTLDGANHSLKGIEYSVQVPNAGIIATIEATGAVKNLTIAGNISAADEMNGTKVVVAAQYLGGLAGVLYGSLDNCVNAMTVVSTSSKGYVGGLVGHAFTGASLNKCVNKGKVQGITGYSTGRVAGLVAQAEKEVTFTDCSNEGVIAMEEVTPGKSTAGNYLAGIAAEAFNSTFTRCSNSGSFELPDDGKNVTIIAGILAYARSSSSNNGECTFNECYNDGDISSKGTIGGILAKSDSYHPNYFTKCSNFGDITVTAVKKESAQVAGIASCGSPGSKFEGCWNEGNINSNLNQYAAGIVSSPGSPKETAPVIIDNCYNTGDITSNGGLAGGIVASSPTYTFITNCYNTGNISGSFDLGGITGALAGKAAYAQNCYNTGKITGSQYELGGIVGKANGLDALIINCWNGGDVETTSIATDSKGGSAIGGICGTPWYEVKYCYNLGAVTGATGVGGIGGVAGNTGGTKVSNCYSVAPVTVTGAPDTDGNLNGGAIFGIEGRATSYPDMNDIIINCYFSNQYESNRLDNLGTGMTTAAMTSSDFALLDETFVSGGDYCLPVFKGDETKAAKLYSAAVVLDAEDTYKNVTKSFKIGAPEGVTWISDCAALSISGNDATFTEAFKGEINLVASMGELTRVITLTADVSNPSGINAVENGAEILSTRYVDMQGREVANPQAGATVIKIDTLTDGNVKVSKSISK